MAKTNPTGGSIHRLMAIDHALRTAGLSDEDLQAIVEVPAIAGVVSSAVHRAIAEHSQTATPTQTTIRELELSHRAEMALAYLSITTVEDLKLVTEFDLMSEWGVGKKTLQTIKDVAQQYGFQLFQAGDDPLARAIVIAGSAELVPARLMKLWQPGLDSYSIHYLRRVTLGELSSMTQQQVMEARRNAHFYLSKSTNDKAGEVQSKIIGTGLRYAGLSLLGE